MKTFLKIFSYLSVVFTPIIPALLWLGFFVFADTFTGIWKAKKDGTYNGSSGITQTVSKVILYFLAVILSHIIDTQFLNISWLPAKVEQLMAGFIAFIEFKSVIENISSILGVPLWKWINDKIKNNVVKKP